MATLNILIIRRENTTRYHILLRNITYNVLLSMYYVLLRTTYYYVLRTTTYYVLLRSTTTTYYVKKIGLEWSLLTLTATLFLWASFDGEGQFQAIKILE